MFCTFWDSLLSKFAEPYHMPFCSRPWPYLGFSIWSCFHLGCIDLCSVTLLCLWILFGIFSLPQGTIHSLLASSRSLPVFVLLISSTSSVGNLWICNWLEQFLYLGPFGLMWSFLWSSSQVLVQLVSICSFLVLVCYGWSRIYWTRIHVFHRGLVFSSLIFFSVFLSISMCISAFGSSSSSF